MTDGDELRAMRAAWDRLRPARPDWPASFEDALRLPLLAALLRTFARHPAAVRDVIERRAPAAPPRDLNSAPAWDATGPGEFDPDHARVPARPTKPPAQARRRWPGIDLKRRAAGEKPED